MKNHHFRLLKRCYINTKCIEKDSMLLDILLNNYQQVYFWPQGSEDLQYFHQLSNSNRREIQIIDSHLNSLNAALELSDIEYIGTRLHAGIRALQKKKRSMIISIDNRATEMHRDFNLPVICRSELNSLQDKIQSERDTSLKIPHDAIKMWKDQFNNLNLP